NTAPRRKARRSRHGARASRYGRSMASTAVPVGGPAASSASAPPGAIERPDFEVVPRKGLIGVAIVFAAVIAAIAANKLWPLAFLHFVGGASWTVIDLFLGFVLGPILGKLSIPARIEVTTPLMPKLLRIMPTIVPATLAAGWQLGVHLGTVDSSYYHHGWTVASFIVVG